MSRLSKAQIAAHRGAERLLSQDRLSDDDREFVLDNWQESATNINSAAGAFFTPSGLALDAAIYTTAAETILDLCAGIGCLGLTAWWRSNQRARVTCVEVNPAYVDVGRKLFPEAAWICASVDALPKLPAFDCVISNPPFGRTAKIKGPRYSGEDDLAVVDIASDLARWGVFILPSMSCPFVYSGEPNYRRRPTAKHDRFQRTTGLRISCESIDASYHRATWRGVSPAVEVVSVDFDEARQAREQAEMPLLANAE